MAVEEASFRMSMDWMSWGLMSRSLAPITPSITTNGSVAPVIVFWPRMSIEKPWPGLLLVLVITTPVTWPWRAWVALAGLALTISRGAREPTAPVRSFFLTDPYPTTTTSSSCLESEVNLMERSVWLEMATSCDPNPMELITRTAFPEVGTSIENLPSLLVVVPFVVPFNVMLAPATTAPLSPWTVPLILRVCAKAMVVISARKETNKSFFLIMAVLVNDCKAVDKRQNLCLK